MRCAIGVLVILGTSWSARSDGAITKQQMLEMYGPAATRLRDFYGSLKMSGVYRQTWLSARDPNTLTNFSDTFTLFTNRGKLRMDWSRVDGRVEGKPERRSAVAGPDQSFAVSRESKSGPYTVEEVRAREPDDGHACKVRFYGIFAPNIDTDGVPLIDRFNEPTTEILDVAESGEGDGARVTVSARFRRNRLPPNPNRSADFSGSFTFLRNKSWALAEARWEQKDAKYGPIRCQLQYDGEKDGIPLLKRSQYWVDRPMGEVEIVDCQVIELVPGAPATEDFTLAAFGIKDIGEQREANSAWWLYLIGGGVLLVAAAIVLARLASRRTAGV